MTEFQRGSSMERREEWEALVIRVTGAAEPELLRRRGGSSVERAESSPVAHLLAWARPTLAMAAGVAGLAAGSLRISAPHPEDGMDGSGYLAQALLTSEDALWFLEGEVIMLSQPEEGR